MFLRARYSQIWMADSFGQVSQVSLPSCYQMILTTDDLAMQWRRYFQRDQWSFGLALWRQFSGHSSCLLWCFYSEHGDGDDCYSDEENCDGDGLQRSAAALKRRLSVRSCELISIFSLWVTQSNLIWVDALLIKMMMMMMVNLTVFFTFQCYISISLHCTI